MNKYRNPRSKTKAKARAKRLANEMCQAFTTSTSPSGSGSADLLGECAQSPEEFFLAEAKPKRMRVEPDTIVVKRRKRKFKEPKQVTAAA